MPSYLSWIVFVRGVSGDADVYGIFGSEESAQRKADAINKRLPQDVESEAWAYPMPLRSALVPADRIIEIAGVSNQDTRQA